VPGNGPAPDLRRLSFPGDPRAPKKRPRNLRKTLQIRPPPVPITSKTDQRSLRSRSTLGAARRLHERRQEGRDPASLALVVPFLFPSLLLLLPTGPFPPGGAGPASLSSARRGDASSPLIKTESRSPGPPGRGSRALVKTDEWRVAPTPTSVISSERIQ